MKKPNQALVIIIIIAVLIFGAAFLVPEPDGLGTLIRLGEFKPSLAITAMMTWLHIGAAWLFLMGLDIFKEKLRQAYKLICLGLVLLGVGLIQLPIVVAFGFTDSAWVMSGGLAGPSIVAWLLVVAGLRAFARAVGDKSLWTSLPFTLLAMTILAAGAGWLSRDLPDMQFNSLSFAGNTFNGLLGLSSVVLVLRIKHRAGPVYTSALAWFVLPFATSVLGIVMVLAYEMLGTRGGSAVGLPFVTAAALYVKAGYAFNKIREY